ncbi:3-oxoacid CoA-transferase subunit B [Radiobacillus sp. PE A8.2]|uniref:3-oxoacid CoA-transferase subunit B n=1 Tax=Radiobacillus sp. PE A8.2 TaxID=3380349 RepID=UPI00388E9239
MNQSKTNLKETIAKRVAKEMNDGDVINLGIGIPTLVPNYLREGIKVILQSENGFTGLGPLQKEIDPELVNAGGQPTGIIPGAAFFDSNFSFQLIRGGHIDVTVLGALEVDTYGNLASWMIPGKMIAGMGGAMDLVTGAKKVIIAMEHCTKSGASKIVDLCQLPLTGKGVVDLIVTELAVFRVSEEGLILEDLQEGVELGMVIEKTEATFKVGSKFAPQ